MPRADVIDPPLPPLDLEDDGGREPVRRFALELTGDRDWDGVSYAWQVVDTLAAPLSPYRVAYRCTSAFAETALALHNANPDRWRHPGLGSR